MSMAAVDELITEHIDIWTSAVKRKSSSGRGGGKKIELYGVKKLRELILDLAVRGLLVPQDPDDEPASVLLERVAAEREILVDAKKAKRQKPLSEIEKGDQPFQIPPSWEYSRLGTIIQISSVKGLTAKAMASDGSVPVFGGNGITGYHSEGNVFEETLVIGRVGFYCGSVHVTPKDAWVTDNAFITAFSRSNIFLHFLKWLLRATNLKEDENATAQPVISGRKIYPIVVAVPPLAEQHRIVAKVDELMALCDQLEQQTEASLTAHQTLVQTLLDALTQAAAVQPNNPQCATDAPTPFEQAWNRLAEHFDTVFTTEDSIEKLKQTILQLAVMGKLVPQDPNDEPASVLLERIAAEKAELVKAKKIKKQKALPEIGEEEKPFALPEGWDVSRFDDLIDQRFPIAYGVLVPGESVENGVPFVRIGDLSLDPVHSSPAKTISADIDKKYTRTRLRGGEILMAIVGSIGKLGVAPDSWKGANIARALCRIEPSKEFYKPYLLLLLQSGYMQDSFLGDTRTLAQPTLNIGLIRSSVTPIPPYEEQHRIVTKVDELMALCDTINVEIAAVQKTRLQLTDVVTKLEFSADGGLR